MAKKNFITNEIGILDKGIESIFHSMIQRDRKEFEDAIDFLESCVNKVPHHTVIRSILFEILMDRECTDEVAISAGLYLQNILRIHPPSDFSRRCYYKGALTYGNNIFQNIWEAFCRFVESSLCHHNIYSVPQEELDKIEKYEIGLVQSPNCDILVEYFIKVFVDSYEYLSSERSFFENKEKSLVAELFWPSSSATKFSAADTNPRKFLTWINSIYDHQVKHASVFQALHQLLNLMIRCVIDSEYMRENSTSIETSDALICNSSFLIDVVKVLMNVCKEIFASHRGFRRIMNYLTLKSLKIKLCEYRLHELIYTKFPSDKSSPTTLKDIASKYVFYNKTRKGRPKRTKPPPPPEPKEKENQQNIKDKKTKDKPKQKAKQHLRDKQNLKAELPKISIKLAYKDGATGNAKEMKFAGETLLHEACRTGKPADMYEILNANPAPDVNAKNSVGYTALHLACLSDGYLCAKVLVDECGEKDSVQKLNWTPTDDNGYTPLHFAVHSNACATTRMLLKYGGSHLLNAVDKSGRKPHHYANSKEIEEALTEFTPPDFKSDVEETSADVEEPPADVEEPPVAVKETAAAPEPASQQFNLDQPIPPMNNFKDSALHLHALQYLLCYYSDVYHIFEALELINKGQSEQIRVNNHEDKACLHYKPYEEMTLCSVDFELIKNHPTIISNFLSSAVISAEENNLQLDIELLPLKMHLAALNS